jgi:hypothetical protein
VPAFVIGLLMALLIAPTTLAAVSMNTSGKIGPFVIRDDPTRPGVVCTYDAGGPNDMGNDLDLMDARGPRVFARDRNARRNKQAVSVAYRFQHSALEGGNGGWVTAKAFKQVKKTAYDDQAATFPRRSWLVPFDQFYHYRVLVIIRWFKPGSKTVVQGLTKQRYVYYLPEFDGPLPVEQDRCLPNP